MNLVVAAFGVGFALASQPAAAEGEFCKTWNTLRPEAKDSFTREQARILLSRDAPEYWRDYGACISEDVAQWIQGVDGACTPPDSMDFDGGRMLGAAVATSLLRCRFEVTSRSD